MINFSRENNKNILGDLCKISRETFFLMLKSPKN